MIVAVPCEASFAPDTLEIGRKRAFTGTCDRQITSELIADDLQRTLLCLCRDLTAVAVYHVAVFLDQFICRDLRDLFVESDLQTGEECGMVCHVVFLQCVIAFFSRSVYTLCYSCVRILAAEGRELHLIICAARKDQCRCIRVRDIDGRAVYCHFSAFRNDLQLRLCDQPVA